METNLQFRLAARPVGMVKDSDWQQTEEPLRPLADGEIRVKVLYLSLDPAMRGWMNEGKSYIRPVAIGEVMRAGGVGVVVESRSPRFADGDHVSGGTGVQRFWTGAADDKSGAFYKIDPKLAPLTTYLNTLGMPGMTAYFGLLESGQPKAGETVVVSGAAGAVGQTVGQVAKQLGCRVVGIAGGKDKCDFVVKQLGFDACIDYKNESVKDGLKQHCPQGVDVYFDNVGGMVTDAIIPLINRRARIVICGQISQYSGGLETPELGPRLLHHMLYQRATIQGMLARDYLHRMDEMIRIVGPWVKAGEIVFEETVIDGFEQLPSALNSLFTGDHRGKLLVKA